MTSQDASLLDLASLRSRYGTSRTTPSAVVGAIFDRIAARGNDGVWISVVDRSQALARARQLEAVPSAQRAALPLWGIPFSVKDCIDVAGMPTTSACPGFAYVPERSSPAVDRLLEAGAILIGKTNMDQFATGLVGVRSPYGIARNPFGADYIPGGSSSGAAVSVSDGLVSLALGTDTGGSGRVPAAFTNVVGLKPTRGQISGVGTVPACRSIETISIFALTVADAWDAFEVIRGFDPDDPFARRQTPAPPRLSEGSFRFGVPAAAALDFFGDGGAEALFAGAVDRLIELGGVPREIDYGPFLEINELLFRGPWLAERYGALSRFASERPEALWPITREILAGGAQVSGAAVFAAQERLGRLKRGVDDLWSGIDVLVVPTTGSIPTIADVAADPIGLNARLGTYTNFVNLADLAAVAVPSGFLPNGLPQGLTVVAPAFADRDAAALAARLQRATALPFGAAGATARSSIPQQEQVT